MHAVTAPEDAPRVIALVASAGGLAAVSAVLEGLPENLDAAVLVLIHQAPDRENALVRLLQAHSALRVIAAEDGARLQLATAYVAPPGKHLLVMPGPALALIASGAIPPSRPSADLLLATLATACGARATAVVLSGGGHDGATGATAVHHCGGAVLACSEATSAHFSMPRAVIERGDTIDRVVPLDEIAGLLTSPVSDPPRQRGGVGCAAEPPRS